MVAQLCITALKSRFTDRTLLDVLLFHWLLFASSLTGLMHAVNASRPLRRATQQGNDKFTVMLHYTPTTSLCLFCGWFPSVLHCPMLYRCFPLKVNCRTSSIYGILVGQTLRVSIVYLDQLLTRTHPRSEA
ncbi:hypothetical protein CONLIGDRAFT_45057 [Coniochaeta ligniaria NRRL 30616]|uniref:Uncharacterized protein n=1 Tax=Coniochaeta ligniaria NRRL 30616 TaxID=1408157 RepID=A0A1J7J5W7_9PEZI|nr:hypothetical protein CONLIGDRAFT_45057 [Coniochaeta ligniaria NRRL 30616]